MEKDLAFVITEKDGHEYKIYFDGRVTGFKDAHVVNYALPVLVRYMSLAGNVYSEPLELRALERNIFKTK